MAKFRSWGDYVYPGSQTLVNLRGITQLDQFREFEEAASRLRASEYFTQGGVDGGFDREHMCAIHRYLFRDVYAWAGELRVGPNGRMSKGGPSPTSIARGNYTARDGHQYDYFPAGEAMTEHFDRWAGALNTAGNLSAVGTAEFVDRICEPWGEMNVAHLFREGNTRTQVAFFHSFAQHHGHFIDFARFTHDPAFRGRFNAGRFLQQATGDESLFRQALAEIVDLRTKPTAQGQSDDVLDPYSPNYAAEDE